MVKYTNKEKNNAKKIKIAYIKQHENIELFAELHKNNTAFEIIEEFEKLKKNKKVKNCSYWMATQNNKLCEGYKLILYEKDIIDSLK